MSKTTNRFSPEVLERAVRLVLDNQGKHGSRWQAVLSISSKFGCAGSLPGLVRRGHLYGGQGDVGGPLGSRLA